MIFNKVSRSKIRAPNSNQVTWLDDSHPLSTSKLRRVFVVLASTLGNVYAVSNEVISPGELGGLRYATYSGMLNHHFSMYNTLPTGTADIPSDDANGDMLVILRVSVSELPPGFRTPVATLDTLVDYKPAINAEFGNNLRTYLKNLRTK